MAALLDGIRVLELSEGLAGAFCGKTFAGLGAEVILVERPVTGCQVRREPPFLDDVPGAERSCIFLYTGMGKRSLTLAPDTACGSEILKRLLKSADILIEDKTEQTSATVIEGASQINPHLVRVTLSNLSRGGPYEGYVTTELQLGALGGWMAQLGEPARNPILTNSRTQTAFVPGLMGAIAGLAAILRARQSGEGTNIDLSAHESLLFNTRYNETYYSYTGMEIKRHGKSFAGWSPTYRVFEAADGFVSCAASTDAQVEFFLQLAGIELNRFATRELRYGRAQELVDRLNAWTRSKTKDEIFHLAQQWRIPMGKVSTIDEMMHLEQLQDRCFFEKVDHPIAGLRAYPGIPVRLDGVRPSASRAPMLGEHTVEILSAELGYSREDLATLVSLRVI